MPANRDTQRYLDTLAQLLGIVAGFPLPINQLFSIQGYEAAAGEVKASLDRGWDQGFPGLFSALDTLIASFHAPPDGQDYVRAAAASLWMDQQISYEQSPGPRRISFYDIVPLSGDEPVFPGIFNRNGETAGVQLHPKFEVCQVYNRLSEQAEPLANRDVFNGLNGQLHHVSCARYDPRHVIHHVVLPYDYGPGDEEADFRIAFCPMSDDPHLLELEEQPLVYRGIEMRGRRVKSVNHKEVLLSRFREDLTLACEARADVVFFPEMLGMEALEVQSAGSNVTILDHALEIMNKALETGRNLKLPSLILLPTWWRDGINSATAVYQDGRVLGAQEKYIPYVNMKDHWVEALRETEERHTLVIHIPGVHRIAVVICAEFQPLRDHMADVLCGSLGATLILVPSYSKGEQDFINSLSTLEDYGASVVWGNCCGAARVPRVTGGCSIAGIDEIQRFGAQCMCGQSCEGIRACLYLIRLPLALSREKPQGPSWENPVEHRLLRR